MSEVLISIIVPCFNAATYIKKCVQSFLSQDFQAYELIIIDDCSTDESFKVLTDAYSFTRNIRLFRNGCNSGPAVSRNLGIKMARGEYLAFCDSDDWVDSSFFSVLSSLLHDQQPDLVFFNHRKVFQNRKSKDFYFYKSLKRLSVNEALVNNLFSLCTLCVKSSIAKQVLIPDIRNGEDYATVPLWVQLSSSIISIPNVLYNYFMSESSTSRMPSDNAMSNLLQSFQFVLSHSREKSFEIEYLGICNCLYGATFVGIKTKKTKPDLFSILDEFNKRFPSWAANPYLHLLPKYKRLYLLCLRKHLFFPMRVYVFLHTKLVR